MASKLKNSWWVIFTCIWPAIFFGIGTGHGGDVLRTKYQHDRAHQEGTVKPTFDKSR